MPEDDLIYTAIGAMVVIQLAGVGGRILYDWLAKRGKPAAAKALAEATQARVDTARVEADLRAHLLDIQPLRERFVALERTLLGSDGGEASLVSWLRGVDNRVDRLIKDHAQLGERVRQLTQRIDRLQRRIEGWSGPGAGGP